MRHRQFTVALLVQVLGAGGALLVSIPAWQRLTAAREGPYADVHVAMNGREVDAAITAFALVALAGVVAVLATKGRWRRVVGVIVALAGAATVVRAVTSLGAVSNARAVSFISDHRPTVTTKASSSVRVEVVAAWPVLTAVCGVLVLAAGVAIAVRGGRWQTMSARYERVQPVEDDAARAGKASAAMWSALDRGDDPTAP